MRLTRLTIEGFRGIRRVDMPLDPVTVVIGEHNHGKTSLFDVLGLCLARRGAFSESRFREDDFHRYPDGRLSSIKIVLTFSEEGVAGGEGVEGDGLEAARTRDADGVRRIRAELRGSPEGREVKRRFVDEDGAPLDPQPDSALFERVQRLHPVLLLRFAQPYQEVRQTGGGSAPDGQGNRRGRRDLEGMISRVYHDLTHARGPLPPEEIAQGLRAARRLFASEGPDADTDAPLGRMLNEILADSLARQERPSGSAFRVRAGSGSHTVGILLVLGALLEVRGEEVLPGDARPIIAIEEPAAHLHPTLLASTWDVIEALRAQTFVATNSGELLSSIPMKSLRRLVRTSSEIGVRRLGDRSLTAAELRRLSYHIRARRGGVLFARCWLLVEGESEFWLTNQLAHVLGVDLDSEGVRCVEFAQCGVTPLVKLANDLGIQWHLLADGDESGAAYAREAARHLAGQPLSRRVSQLAEADVERALWKHGFEDVYRRAADGPEGPSDPRSSPARIIAKAVRKKSKPYLALQVAQECAARGPASIPPVLRGVIETSVLLARESVAEGGGRSA